MYWNNAEFALHTPRGASTLYLSQKTAQHKPPKIQDNRAMGTHLRPPTGTSIKMGLNASSACCLMVRFVDQHVLA